MSTHVMTGTEAYDSNGRRVRAVLRDESEVAHYWAAQAQSHGRFRAIYFSGRVLYSYGSHYVIGRIEDDGATVLLNADGSSKTTNGHRSSARYATQHRRQFFVPSLNQALNLADEVARYRHTIKGARKAGEDFENPESYASRSVRNLETMRQAGRAFVFEHAARLDDSAALYLLGLYGWPATSWPKIRREAEAAAKADKLKAERRAKARALADAKRFGDMSEGELTQFWPPDSYLRDAPSGALGTLADGSGAYAQSEFAKRLARAHKASKAAGYTARTRRLWQRLKAFRAYAAERPERERSAEIAERRAEFMAWKAGTGSRPAIWRFKARELAAELAELESANAAEVAAKADSDYETWRRDPAAELRPDSWRFEHAPLTRSVLEGFERQEAEDIAAKLEAWRRSPKLAARPSYGEAAKLDSFPDILERLGGDPREEALSGISKAEAERRKAEREAAEALRAADIATKAEAWRNGADIRALGHVRLSDPSGGALLRIEGEPAEPESAELVTSHGARVPLLHAIKAFRFVKLIRERGETWERNGRQLRVGHYQLDSIDSVGFNAGCHRINWPEIERVAKLAGVFELPAADTAETSH